MSGRGDARPVPDNLLDFGPTAIGATGGSGTRVLARLARGAGLFIGEDLNAAEDARPVGAFVRRWIGRYLADRGSPAWTATEAAMRRALEAAVAVHCAPLAGQPRPWGWKVPRSIFLLPFLDDAFPALKFVHLVRDGRDMAFSDNQGQLVSHGDAVLDPGQDGWDAIRRSLALWSRVNLDAAEYGEREMGNRYLRLRFEDLCRDPEPSVRRLLDFLELDADAAALVRQEVHPPSSLGRWADGDPAVLADLRRIGGDALRRFGYADSGG
jgi:hypothetical protein